MLKVKDFDLDGKVLIKYVEDTIISLANKKGDNMMFQVNFTLKKILKKIKKSSQSVTKLKKAEIEKTIVIVFDSWVEEDPVKNQKMDNNTYFFDRKF